jgi:acetyl esterase/lipase
MLALLVLAAPLFAEPATQPSYTRREDVVYGRFMGTALTLDVFKPTGEKNGAIIIFIMSGGFRSDHAGIGPATNVFFRPFLDRGYVVCAVVHGSAPKFTIAEIAPQIRRAVQYVRANAKETGLDPDRIGITGGSAGGHLSLLAAMSPVAANPSSKDYVERVSGKIAAVACFYPPTDFLNWGEPGKSVLRSATIGPYNAAFDFHEFSDATNMLMPVSDARKAEILRELSPITYVSASSPPTLIIHGDADALVPLQQSISMVEKLKANHVDARLDVKKDFGHGWPGIGQDVQTLADWFDAHLLTDKKAAASPARAP